MSKVSKYVENMQAGMKTFILISNTQNHRNNCTKSSEKKF